MRTRAELLAETERRLLVDPRRQREIMLELRSSLDDAYEEYLAAGCSPAEAETLAVQSFGRPAAVAGALNDAWGRASWASALACALPHLLAAAVFLTVGWASPAAAAVLAGAAGVALLGHRLGTPLWTYTWAGYALFAVFGAGYLALRLAERQASNTLTGGGALSFGLAVLGLGFVLLAVLFLMHTVHRLAERDWLPGALALLPAGPLLSWLVATDRSGGLVQLGRTAHQYDGAMAAALLALGAGAAVALRPRRRQLKLAAFSALALATEALVIHAFDPSARPLALALRTVAVTAVVFLPLAFVARSGLEAEAEGSIVGWFWRGLRPH